MSAPAGARGAGRERGGLTDAPFRVFRYLNYPHPGRVITNPGAYGAKGQIMRYHATRSYILGLQALLRRADGPADQDRAVASPGAAPERNFFQSPTPDEEREGKGAGGGSPPRCGAGLRLTPR